MERKYRLPGFVLILIGIIVGALVFSNVSKSNAPSVLAMEQSTSIDTLKSAAERPIRTLKDFNNALVDIAKAVTPTVVTVFTEKVYKINESPFPFFNTPFEDFFGDFFGGKIKPQKPKKKEFVQEGMGSGVIVSADGYILTNNHVVKGADKVRVRLIDKRTFEAKVIGTDPKTDIALIKIDAKDLPVAKLGDSDKLQVGEMVLAIGSPLNPNLDHTVTSGIVSAKGRSNMGLADYEDFIQTDAAINPGNSGGALVNLDGEVVGINSAIATQSGGFQGIGFAVPINMAKEIMEQLKTNGKVVRGYLGAYIQDLTPTMAEAMNLSVKEGALIADVMKNGPAEKAGIKAGDVVIAFNGKKIRNSTQLRNWVASTKPGTEVTLKVLRDGDEKEIDVKLGTLEPEKVTQTSKVKLQDLFGFNVAAINSRTAKKYGIPEDVSGVIVVDLKRFSPAARAGLGEGDVILAVNNHKIDGIDSFNKTVKNLKKGDVVILRVQKGERKFFVAFTLGG
jgi:serine protease Do